ncbi:MAG: hypothetical protein ACREBQ_08370 [Nitrososphaerales archaeon]
MIAMNVKEIRVPLPCSLESSSSFADFPFDNINTLLIQPISRDQGIVVALILTQRQQANLSLAGITSLSAAIEFSR